MNFIYDISRKVIIDYNTHVFLADFILHANNERSFANIGLNITETINQTFDIVNQVLAEIEKTND